MRFVATSGTDRRVVRFLIVTGFVLGGALSACDHASRAPGAQQKAPPSGAEPQDTLADADGPPSADGLPPDVDVPPDEAEGSPAAPSGAVRLGVFPPAASQEADAPLLALRRWVHRNKGHVHAVLIDLEAGRVLASHRADEAVNPASNMKVLTAAASLDLLGPAHTFKTELWDRSGSDGAGHRLVLRGGGDPGLSTADLARLARAASAAGARDVSAIGCDQRRFDEAYVPPAFEQQPNEWAAFRAPIAALSVDRNSVVLQVSPEQAGSPAVVTYEPPGVVASAGQILTQEGSAADRVTWSLDPSAAPQRPSSRVGGSLGQSLGRRRYTRRLADPRLAGCYALAELMGELGVLGERKVSAFVGSAAERGERLTYLSSSPVAELLKPLGKESDNFTAEMMLVALSQTDGGKPEAPWSSGRGAQRLLGWLKEGGIPTQTLQIRNGSGLFDANRLTAEVLALTLARMESRPEVFAEFLSQLSVYGTDGTLRNRMKSHPERSRVRAKTGTLRDVDSLSGYILRPAGGRPLVFSLLITDTAAAHGAVRAELDRTVFAWLTALAPRAETSEAKTSEAEASRKQLP